MSTQHTPGPWIWGPNARLYADASLPECQRVMNVQIGKTTALCWDIKDARLIAAAPDLFKALKALVSTARTFRNVPKDEQEWTSIDDDALKAAFDAIAKATGEKR